MRFPRFEGEWIETTLGNCSQSLDYGMNAAATEFDGENKYIRITDINESTSKYIPDMPVSPEGELEEKYLVKENDILFARTGASTGKTYLYQKEDGKLYFAGFLIRAKINNANNACFIFNQTKTSFYNKWVKLTSMRSGQPGINSQEYASFKFWIPSKREQDKIALFLSLLDDRISTQNKIIAQLQTLMQGLGEQLFKQQIRFKDENGNDFPEWEEKKLEELVKISSGLSQDQNNSNGYKVTRIETISDGTINIDKFGLIDTNSDISEYKIAKGDILFSNINSVSHIGKTAIAKEDLELYHGMNLLRLKSLKNIAPLFLFYALNTSKQRAHFRSICNQAVNQASINQTELGKTKIIIPSIPEQQKIARFLSLINENIETEKKILQQYESQKKYLLQKMFI